MPLPAPINTFAANPLDRASAQRSDEAWVAEKLADPTSLGLALWNGKPLIEDTEGGKSVQIAYFPADMAKEMAGGEEQLLFMGLWKDTAVFAVDLDGIGDPAAASNLSGIGRFEELRAVALQLPAADAGILATAKAMFEWRRRHRWCSACGQPSKVADGGWKRVCPACETEHFPRTDPVVIMLAVHGDKCLLGRQSGWPKGMHSALAGFLEPGETIEEACARELEEEAGLKATSVRYHSTQPWPYPSSLMIGLIAEVDSDQAAPDQTELESVRWFSREEAAALLKGEIKDAFAPPPLAIAHQLLKAWSEGF